MRQPLRAAALAVAALLLLLPAAARAEKSDAFQPLEQGTVSLAATTSSGNVAVNVRGQVRVYNSGTVPVFINLATGNSITASTTADVPIAPGTVEVLTGVGDHIAGITASGSATIYFTPGAGL